MGLSRDRLSEEELAIEKSRAGIREILNNRPEIMDFINHPPHYTSSEASCSCGKKIECIDVTRHLNFNIGNAIKYLWRCELKGANVEDLRKAIWYIQDEIKKKVENGS